MSNISFYIKLIKVYKTAETCEYSFRVEYSGFSTCAKFETAMFACWFCLLIQEFEVFLWQYISFKNINWLSFFISR